MALDRFSLRPGAFIGRLAVAIALTLMTSVGGIAQSSTADSQAPDPGSVVATIGDDTITEADLGYAAEDLAQELANVPAGERRAYILAIMVDMKVMANAARASGMADTDTFKRRLGYLEDRALRRAYFSDLVASKVTPEAMQAAYQKMIADFAPEEEVHARHILVASKEEADAVKAEIDGGKPFEMAALESSTDGSATNGGDLGFFTRGMMVPAFETAAFALEVGQVSDAVQSQFGWHLIKLVEKRMSSPPDFDAVSRQLQQQVLIDAFNAEIKMLKGKTDVTYADPAMAAAVALQSGEDTGE